jgi:uncharacterized protein (TIGR02444 family)
MNTNLSDVDLSLLDFSTAFYAKPKIQSACLILQDQYGMNVPLLLCCCWAGLHNGALPEQLLQKMKQYTETYSLQTIEPLRAIRKAMKNNHDREWPITLNDWQDLREGIKKIELSAEYSLLASLEKLIVNSQFKPLIARQKANIQANCSANIAVCFESVDFDHGKAKDSLVSIFDVICSLEDH